jgi:hypothetical protein
MQYFIDFKLGGMSDRAVIPRIGKLDSAIDTIRELQNEGAHNIQIRAYDDEEKFYFRLLLVEGEINE